MKPTKHNTTGNQAFRLLSSVYGRIDQIVLTQSGYSTPWSDKRLKDIRKVFERAGIETITLVNRQDQSPRSPSYDIIDLDNPFLAEIMARGRQIDISARFVFKNWHEDIQTIEELGLPFAQSQWVQDAFCVQNYDGNYQVLLQPLYSNRITDQFISTELALESTVQVLLKPTELRLEGGNILVGDDFALVGQNTLAINWIEMLRSGFQDDDLKLEDEEFLREHLEGLKKQFVTELGVRDIIWVGFPVPRMELFGQQKYMTFQSAYHLDLFLTLGGKSASGEEIIFLADPRMGRKIAEEVSGEPVQAGLEWDGSPVSDGFIDLYFDDMVIFFHDYQSLKSNTLKFKIVRLPMLIEQGVAYTFNNSLVDDFDEIKRAFCPNYIVDSSELQNSRKSREMNEKMKALQLATEKILRAEGFDEVHWTGEGIHLQNFAARKGSLRCMSKVLRRS